MAVVENTPQVYDVVASTTHIVHYTDRLGTRSLIPVLLRSDDETKPMLTFKVLGERLVLVPVPSWLEKKARVTLSSANVQVPSEEDE